LGASAAFNYREVTDWDAQVKEHNGGQGVDCVLDFIGGDYMQRNLAVLGKFGKLVIIGFLGSAVSTVNMAPVLLKVCCLLGLCIHQFIHEYMFYIRH
jgi:NADPH2:quinone reductase